MKYQRFSRWFTITWRISTKFIRFVINLSVIAHIANIKKPLAQNNSFFIYGRQKMNDLGYEIYKW
jgi:hypothetical protein